MVLGHTSISNHVQSVKKVLVHICCAPCSTAVIERLQQEGYEVACYFYNPNLHPPKEYQKRADEMVQYARRFDLEVYEGSYDHSLWLSAVSGLEHEPEGGSRCKQCYRLRLEATATEAKKRGCEGFTTTLTISPHKRAAIINPIGHEIAKRYDLEFLPRDFKKRDGFKRSLELSHEADLYRQDYCGCEFSLAEARKRREQRESKK